MKLTAVDKALGVAESTGQCKSMEIRKMLKIRSRFDINWTLPRRMGDTYGILCEARIEGRVVTLPLGELDDVKGKPNRQLIADYCCWLHNFA